MSTRTKYFVIRQSAANGATANVGHGAALAVTWSNSNAPAVALAGDTGSGSGIVSVAYDPTAHGAAGGYVTITPGGSGQSTAGCIAGDLIVPVSFDVGDANVTQIGGDSNGVTTNFAGLGAVWSVSGQGDTADAMAAAATVHGMLLALGLQLSVKSGAALRDTLVPFPEPNAAASLTFESQPNPSGQGVLGFGNGSEWYYQPAPGNANYGNGYTLGTNNTDGTFLGTYTRAMGSGGDASLTIAVSAYTRAVTDTGASIMPAAASPTQNIPADVVNAVIAAAVSAGLVQYVPGGSSGSSSSGIAEPPMQFTPQALAQAPPSTAVSISTQDMIIR